MKKSKATILSLLVLLLIIFTVAGRNTISSLMRGRVHFPEENIGTVLKMADGRNFTIFRWLKVDHQNYNKSDMAVFMVRFRFKNLSADINKNLSIIPAPFLMGMKSFREKIWTINESANEFQGLYQWSTNEAAGRYPESFIFRLMTKRAAPGTVSYEIIPATDLSGYISSRRVR